MEIIIGRNQQTQQLHIIKGNAERNYGQVKSVPMDVSRHHISLKPVGQGKWHIKNLNGNNVTFVNGLAIENKIITESDKVELGNSRYLFQWDVLNEPKEQIVDIKPLKRIWEEYEKQKIDTQIAERRFNALRSATGIITMLAIACSIILGHGPVYIIVYVLAIGISIAFTYQAYRKADYIPHQQQELTKRFQQQYVCPKCKHFMGFTDYDLLIQNDNCPYCKTKYKK